jgi:phospholipid/cholesterol/gamma-HCH transport system substrate-binding protein
MQKRAPSVGRIGAIAIFSLSCFGLLLYLWLAFGGAIPLKPKGYRFHVLFPQASNLGDQADVRISGVPVGKVVGLKLGLDGQTDATVELQSRYAPARSDMRATLRAKSLLGETFVELTPGSPAARAIPEGGTLPSGRVAPTVALDEIYRTFDPQTRAAFQAWMQSLAAGLGGQGANLNAALGTLDPFSEDANTLVSILLGQSAAVKDLVRNTGIVFDALTERDNQLRSLVVNSEATFSATAAANAALADTFRALPAFEHSSQVALRTLQVFATNTSPLLTQLRPAAVALAPVTRSLETVAPDLEALLVGLGPLTQASVKGLPAADAVVGDLRPVLTAATPVLRNLIPVLQAGDFYQPEILSFFANTTAATQAHDNASELPAGTPQLHYLRTTNPLNPEGLAVFSQRVGINRTNAYALPGTYSKLATGLPVYDTRGCSNPTPAVIGPPNAYVSQSTIDSIYQLGIAGMPGGPPPPAPSCISQGPFPLNGMLSTFPHVTLAP